MTLPFHPAQKPVQVSLTSEKIVATADEKEGLSQKGSIVEMETAHILAAAMQKQVPCVAVRAISDAADEDLPVDFARILDSHGHLKMGGLLKEVGLSPYRIPLLLQFGRQSRAAGKSLADFLDRYILQSLETGRSSPIRKSRSSRRHERPRNHAGDSEIARAHPKTMRAGVYRDKGVVRVEEVPVPEVGDGEVLIKVAACGICGTDIKKIFQRYVEPPQILGHELAGTVVAVGRGVTKWTLGDRVMSFHHTPCGGCFYCETRLFSQCKQYKTTGLTAGFTPNGGGFAEYVKAMPWVAERGIVALPDNVSFEEATFIEPINTIVKAVQKAA